MTKDILRLVLLGLVLLHIMLCHVCYYVAGGKGV